MNKAIIAIAVVAIALSTLGLCYPLWCCGFSNRGNMLSVLSMIVPVLVSLVLIYWTTKMLTEMQLAERKFKERVRQYAEYRDQRQAPPKRVGKVSEPHKTLGVPVGASQNEIRRAYRALALKCHPDKDRSTGADERFKTIQQAYEALKEG